MTIKTPLLIENRDWQPWELILGPGETDPIKTQQSLETVGKRFRQELGLRSDPFTFRTKLDGKLEVRTSGIAGTVSIGSLVIDVAPKFVPQGNGFQQWSASMLLLMQYARKRDLALNRSQHLAAARHSFIDLLAMAFSDAAEAGLADQPIQTYRTSAWTLPVLRGRLNLSRQLRSVFIRPHLIECDVNQLDTNNEFNDLLKWAAHAFVGAVRSPSLKRKMRDIAFHLPGMPDRRIAFQGGRIRPPPQFRVWAEALEIAELLSSGLTHTAGRGIQQGYSFVFNMERLFEHFVEISLGRVVPMLNLPGLTSHSQVSTPYAQPRSGTKIRFFSRPDNLILQDGKPIIVVDAKYKRLTDAEGMWDRKPVNADVYELVAAMTAHDCCIGFLVYPRVVGDSVLTDNELRMWSINAYGTTLCIGALALDLTGLQTHADLDAVDTKLAEALTSLLEER